MDGGTVQEGGVAGCFAVPPVQDARAGAGVRVASIDAGACAELPAASCPESEAGVSSWRSFLDEPAVAACGDIFDGCRCATFHFDDEGCLAAVDSHEADPLTGVLPTGFLQCLQTALSGRRWECAAGVAVTYFESCGVR